MICSTRYINDDRVFCFNFSVKMFITSNKLKTSVFWRIRWVHDLESFLITHADWNFFSSDIKVQSILYEIYKNGQKYPGTGRETNNMN